MQFPSIFTWFRFFVLALGLALGAHSGLVAAPAAVTDAGTAFKATPQQSLEARALVRLLEQVHYNRDAVKVDNYGAVIGDFMKSLDGQHLFFFAEDQAKFEDKFPANPLYWGLVAIGELNPAFEVFATYKERAKERIKWVLDRLERPVDLTAGDSYRFDREEASWPKDAAEADALWERRLKYELLQELLNKETLEEATATVRKRNERLLKALDDIEPVDVVERFLTTVTHLYDPHSNYFSSDTYEDFSINMRLQLFGIGAVLGLDQDNFCVVKEIIAGGPADLSKQIKPNDKIIAVAQEKDEPVDIVGMKLRKIVDLIRGPKGTKVRLTIQSGSAGDSAARREITITRDVVNIDSARAYGAVFQVPVSGAQETAADAGAPATMPIGVITLPTFYGADARSEGEQHSATEDVAELITRLKTKGIKGLVLDLRNNGGGLLSEAIGLTGLFIKDGPVVQVRSYYGDVKVDSDEDPALAYDGPLVVLTSRFSASASEIVAGALQNYGRAVIIGGKSTHGKGTVQTVIEMGQIIGRQVAKDTKMGATKLTVQKFYLPNGASTQLKGVIPDIVLPSVNDLLPVGESDLPHALPWDEIPKSAYEGRPYSAQNLRPLLRASWERQESLPEFALLKRNIDRFREKQEEKTISLNLGVREQEEKDDDTFRDGMKADRKKLEADEAYAFSEVLLAPPPPPRIKAKDDEEKEGDKGGDPLDGTEDEDSRFAKMDIPLRESLRVVLDMIADNTPDQQPLAQPSRVALDTTH